MCAQRADLPWMSCAVRLELHVRRFFCPTPECPRQIFTERLPRVCSAWMIFRFVSAKATAQS
jgi:hypothetical protein